MAASVNIAIKIHKTLNEEVDLESIKKVIAVYEKLKNNDDDELMSYEDVMAHLHSLLGETTVADTIRAFRDREGMTQQELALKSGIKRQHVSEIERGERNIGVTTAKKLALALNCNYKSLL